MNTSFNVIVAMEKGTQVIGRENDMPWHIPSDLKHFKSVTVGGIVIMGRNTYDSIVNAIGKPLPSRVNIVITRDESKHDTIMDNGVIFKDSLESALKLASLISYDRGVFVIGGGQIYKEAIGLRPKRLHITWVSKRGGDSISEPGDVKFPDIDFEKYYLDESFEYNGDENYELEFNAYQILEDGNN